MDKEPIQQGADPYEPDDIAQKIEITLLKDGRLVTALPSNTLLCYELLIAALHVAQQNARQAQAKAQERGAIVPPDGNFMGKVRMPR